MAQKKLLRFAELNNLKNVLQYPANMAGKWHCHFQNDNPIVLELACGKGEYSVGLAKLYPHKNFIGIDVKGNRLWVGAKKAIAENFHNVAFLRTQIEMLPNYFAPNEIQEIWITFPDPQLRLSKAKKRLTHPRFLRLYKQVIAPDGKIHLKTDSPDLYHFSKKVIRLYNCQLTEDVDDVYNMEMIPDELKIKTHYESLDIAKSQRIHYLSFTLPAVLPDERLDIQLKEMIDHEQTA